MKPKNKAGSAKEEKETSRAAPIPSKEDPVSRAAEAMKNRPKASKYTMKIMSPWKAKTALWCPRGTIREAVKIEIQPTRGPARNTQVVVRLKTIPFLKSFI